MTRLAFIPQRESLWPEFAGLVTLCLIVYALFSIFAPLLAKLQGAIS